jgi:uncharacterized repeat protein (TIGR04052 family)
MLTACSKPLPVNIPFTLSFKNQLLSCEQVNNAKPSLVKLKDFRFYLHDIQLQNQAGQWQTLNLNSQSQWQNESTVLLDFENAKDNCTSGNTATNTVISGDITPDDYQAIRFKVGVPFELNHKNPLTAVSPLNESSMHWHWQGGYKFMRAEFSINNQSRRLHVGSLQCKGEIHDITHCEKPNRSQITLTQFSLNESTIMINLDQLLEQKTANNKLSLTCMGDSQNAWCANARQWLGLSPQSNQSAFKVIKDNL